MSSVPTMICTPDAAIFLAWSPAQNFEAEEGDDLDALDMMREERRPIADHPQADQDHLNHGDAEAGVAQGCADHLQPAERERRGREHREPERPLRIEALGIGVHPIGHAQAGDQEDEPEKRRDKLLAHARDLS
jgi:hypothetical protein